MLCQAVPLHSTLLYPKPHRLRNQNSRLRGQERGKRINHLVGEGCPVDAWKRASEAALPSFDPLRHPSKRADHHDVESEALL